MGKIVGITYDIERNVINDDDVFSTRPDSTLEITISVQRADEVGPPVIFRMLQGRFK